ncbi:MAG: hypothetical protein U0163_13540 [Gemmatimonadaceae bacterium]
MNWPKNVYPVISSLSDVSRTQGSRAERDIGILGAATSGGLASLELGAALPGRRSATVSARARRYVPFENWRPLAAATDKDLGHHPVLMLRRLRSGRNDVVEARSGLRAA